MKQEAMTLKAIDEELAVCKVEDLSQVHMEDQYVFIGKTDEELSLVCAMAYVPKNCTACDAGWRGFRIQGTLDFSLIGILSKISGLLAESKIGIFAISTYNTDYILVKKENFQRAVEVLEGNGYVFTV